MANSELSLGIPWMKFRKSKRIALVAEIDGPISQALAEELIYRLRELSSDDDLCITALILRINSGGGSLGASEAICEAVGVVKQELCVPVFGVVIEQAASAAFHLALAADRLIVAPSALLGSVGAVHQTMSYHGIASRLGLELRVSTEGRFKAANHAFQQFDPVESDGEIRKALQDTHQNFLDWIKSRRPSLDIAAHGDELSGLFTGRRAIAMGVAEQSGGLLTALREASLASGMSRADVMRLASSGPGRREGWLGQLAQRALRKVLIGQ